MTLSLDSIRVEYDGRTVLEVGRLALAPGQLVAVVGPNGAGKTTLVRTAAGAIEPEHGEVTWHELPIRALAAAELALVRAFLPQERNLIVPFTTREVVTMGRFALQRASPSDPAGDASIDEALATFDLAHLAGRRHDRLSGGERARVALARILVQSTPIILLDEPTAALDLSHQESTAARLAAIAEDEHVVAAVFHDLNLAAAHAHRILIVSAGRIVADGTPSGVLDDALLSQVYHRPLAVVPHPFRACPLVVSRD